MWRRLRWLTVLLITVVSCSGCWDSIEIDRRATVVGLGIDAAPGNKVKVSGQFIMIESSPFNIGEKSDKPFITITSVARTVFNAFPGLENQTVKSLFYGQLHTTVVNTVLAERGLKQYLDLLQRIPIIPPQGYIVLTEGTAQDLLSLPLATKFVPVIAINDFLESPLKADQVVPMQVWQFIKDIQVGPTDPYLPLVSYKKEDKVFRFTGFGVFHRDRLVGKLAENESRMAALLMGKAKNAYTLVFVPGMGEVSERRVIARSKIKILQTRPRLKLLVNVKAEGLIRDIPSEATGLNNGDVKRIEKAVATDYKKQMTRTIRHLQSLNSDILGFGDYLSAWRPGYWETIQWNQEYPKADIQVKVSFKVLEFGTYR